jgi:hypothetical protein
VDLLGMKQTCPVSLYQHDGVLDGCRPVEAMSEGYTNQCKGRCMVAALTSMDLCE